MMNEERYYQEIEHLIKRNEVNKRVRKLEENNDLVMTYWNVGRLIVEAQGGSLRAKYGNELIKKWSVKLTELYGKGYDYTNLSRFRKFYMSFPILGTACQLSWSYYRYLISIKDENKRNYYFNIVIKNHLSVRELRKEIKSNSYERLIDKEIKINILIPQKNKITTNMKNPIIIEIDKEIKNEHDLELSILANLDYFFKQLGNGFLYAGHQYKVNDGKNNYYIDILLFNYELNCFIVVELKTRSLRKEDKAQIEYYMKLVDEEIKKPFHNKTIGIIISKESNNFIVNFVKSNDIIPLYYELQKR